MNEDRFTQQVTRAIEQQIGKQVSQVFRDAGLTRELMAVIRDHLQSTRKLIVYERQDDLWCVDNVGFIRFESVSYTACVEWALKQPMNTDNPSSVGE